MNRLGSFLSVGLVILTVVMAVGNWRFIRNNRYEEPAYERRMTIDSITYLNAGKSLAASPTPWYTGDLWHGTGMQVLVGLLFRVTGAQSAAVVKVFNWMCWLFLLLGWAALTWRMTRSSLAALTMMGLLSLSIPLQRFCATAQYDVVLTLLFCLILHAVLTQQAWSRIAAGAGMALLGIFRLHFSLIVVFFAMATVLPGFQRPRSALAQVMVGFGVLALAWNAAYWIKSGSFTFFQGGIGTVVRMSNNPLVQGYAFPFTAAAKPDGFHFILGRPGAYLALLGRRTCYLCGFWPETWFVESGWTTTLHDLTRIPMESARTLFVSVSALSIAMGVRESLRRDRAHRRVETLLPLLILGPIMVSLLVFNSANRYLLPAVPSFIFFQVLAAQVCFQRIRTIWENNPRMRGRKTRAG
ncbi:MAG: hypothetical protein HY077_07555 [Elusimicrobia bacterium]|nr:hypothetical protein [Elusimicrobiota bacterium]